MKIKRYILLLAMPLLFILLTGVKADAHVKYTTTPKALRGTWVGKAHIMNKNGDIIPIKRKVIKITKYTFSSKYKDGNKYHTHKLSGKKIIFKNPQLGVGIKHDGFWNGYWCFGAYESCDATYLKRVHHNGKEALKCKWGVPGKLKIYIDYYYKK